MHPLFGEQKMSRIQTSISAGKTEAGITAKQFVQKGRARPPEAQQENWRSRRGGSYFFREAGLLDPGEEALARTAHPVVEARRQRQADILDGRSTAQPPPGSQGQTQPLFGGIRILQ